MVMNLARLRTCIKRCHKTGIGSMVLVGAAFLMSFSKPGDSAYLNCPVYTMVDTDEHLISLTFDDGPHTEMTPEILDVLKENNVEATFFIVGENARQNDKLIERIITEGHEIGNHTFGHKYLFGEGRADMEREIDLCDDEIFNHSEYNAILFRPPGGLYDATLSAVCAERGYSMVLWSIDTRDWAGTSAYDIEKEILDNVGDGAIILMHDYICGESHTAEALRSVIPKLKALGYRFVTVSELIGG